MLRFKKPPKEDQESTNAARKEGCWEVGGNSEYSVVVSYMEKLMVEYFKKEKRSPTGQIPQGSNHRRTGNCPCNFGSPDDIWIFLRAVEFVSLITSLRNRHYMINIHE